MRLSRKLALLVVGVALASGAAQATSSSSTFTIAGQVTLSNAALVLSPQGLFLADSDPISQLLIETPNAILHSYQKKFVVAESGVAPMLRLEADSSHDDIPISEARITLGPTSQHAGFLGIYPTPGGTLTLNIVGTSEIEPRVKSRIGNEETADAPDRTTYLQEASGPHLLVEAMGTAQYAGAGAIKLLGPDVQVDSSAGSDTYQTGAERTSPSEMVVTWLYIEFEEAMITLAGGEEPFQVLAGDANSLAVNDGTITFTPMSGAIDAPGYDYEVSDGKPASMTGTFAGSLSPQEGKTASLRLEGDLQDTTLAYTRVPVGPFSNNAIPWWPLALVAGTVVTGGTAAYLVLRRRSTTDASAIATKDPVYFTYYADLACEQDDLRLALEWRQAARACAQQDADLALGEAIILHALGDLREAIRAAETAAKVATPDEGRPDYYLAAFFMKTGEEAHHQLAMVHLERALQREPTLANEILWDSVFTPLHGPDFDAMIHEAYARASHAT